MANITFYDQAVDMASADSYITAVQGEVVSSSSTELVFSNFPFELDVHGKKFGDFDSNGLPHSGLIKGFDLFAFGTPVATFEKMHLQVADFDTFVANNDGAGLIEAVLAGNDRVTGSTAGDILTGLDGRDSIDGRAGGDVLIGGAGGDTLTGGDGDDTFVFLSAKDSGKKGVDTITDLSDGDTVDLSAIDADTHTDGDQEFHIVGKLKGHAGEMTVVYDAGHDRTIVSMDVNGDGKADGIIWMAGDHHDFDGFVF
jgi:Ca2+-binding RTX toxin-like protein